MRQGGIIVSRFGKYQKWVVWVLVLAVIAGGGYYYIKTKTNDQQEVKSTAQTATVIRGDIVSMVTGSGSVETAREQELTAPGASTVLSVEVEDGEKVTAGQVLYTLDCPEVDASVQVLSQYEYQLEELEQDRESLNPSAEDDSTVLSVNVKANQTVSKNTVLMTLADTQKMTMKVPEEQGKTWAGGNKLELDLLEYGTNLTATIEGEPTLTSSNGMKYLIFSIKTDQGQRIAAETYAQAYHQGTGAKVAVMLEPQTETEIKASADGIITGLYVKEGQMIKAGATLFQMTSTSLESQISEAKSEMEVANDQLKQKKTTLTADFDGYYYAAATSDGPENTFLQAGDSLDSGVSLGKVVDSSRMQIVFDVDELDIEKIAIGQEVNITADALTGKTFTGKVVRIAQEGSVSSNVAYYWVVIEITDWEGLKVGMTTSLEIVVDQSEDALLVPINAVHVSQGQKYVLLANTTDTADGTRQSAADSDGNTAKDTAGSGTANGSAAATKGAAGAADASGGSGTKQKSLPANAVIVTTGISNDDYVEILSGLEEGQEILVEGTTTTATTQDMKGMEMGMMGGMAMGGGEPPAGGGSMSGGRG
jgi:HlyD family secretion protein